MSGSVKRALALWAASQVEGLHVYADDLANAKHRYPCCTVIELTHGVEPLGCGKKDFTVRDAETGFVAVSGKMHQVVENFRLTVSSPSDRHQNGQEIVDQILEELELGLLLQSIPADSIWLADSATTPSEYFKCDSIKSGGRQTIAPDATGEPPLYSGSLTILVRRTVPIQQKVESIIKTIHFPDNSRRGT